MFTLPLVALTPDEHIQYVCNNSDSYTGSDKWVVVGEFTAAFTDCAPALNGYGVGARYDGTYPNSTYIGSCEGKSDITTWNETFLAEVKNYLAAELGTFEAKTNGWIFWNFKTESAHEWDAFKLLEYGIFPDLKTNGTLKATCSS